MQKTHELIGDFHLHSSFSADSNLSPQVLIRRCQQVGINCIAVTDHDTIEGALEIQKIAPFKVIIGEEISSQAGHVIGLFLKQRIEPGLTLLQTIEEIKSQQGLVIAPHPFSSLLKNEALGQQLIDHLDLFDAVEIFNGNDFLPRNNRLAKAFAEKTGTLKTAGSDAHAASGLGAVKINLPDFSSPESFLKSLAAAEIFAQLPPPAYFIELACLQANFHARRNFRKLRAAFERRKRLVLSE